MGFGISSSAIAAAVWLVGREVASQFSLASRLTTVSVTTAIIGIWAYRRPSIFGPFVTRQTPRLLKERRGGVFIWGLDTGLMVTTVRITFLTWIALLISAVGFATWTSLYAYALGFVVPLTVMVVFVRPRHGREPDWLAYGMYSRRRGLRAISIAVLGTVAAAFGASAVLDGHDRLRLLSFVSRTLLVAVWLSAASSKALHFSRLVSTFTRLAIPRPRASARGLLVAEVMAGLGLATTALGRAPIVLSESLFIGFLLVGVASLRRIDKIECSCFGGEAAVLGWKQVLQFPVLTTLCVVTWLGASMENRRSSLLELCAGSLVVIVGTTGALLRDWERLRQERVYLQDELRLYREQPQTSIADGRRSTWNY